MRLLLTSPCPAGGCCSASSSPGRWSSVLQAYAFLAIAAALGIDMPWQGYLVVPARRWSLPG